MRVLCSKINVQTQADQQAQQYLRVSVQQPQQEKTNIANLPQSIANLSSKL